MHVGLGLYRESLTVANFRFAAQAGVTHIVAHLANYFPGAAPAHVTSDQLWDRLTRFLEELVPVAEEAGVRLAAHPDDPPVDEMRGTARLVNQPHKYSRLLGGVDSRSNSTELCLGTLL